MSAYYNENDQHAARWLRNLIDAGMIAHGDVDERSIGDVGADELAGYSQCHFFAGIGGWSLALRQAGWADDRPVWTGSCPCQPFSVNGKGAGKDDERHLWPVWFNLIKECRPDVVFGEQVEGAIRHGWLDLVQADMEREGYAVGSTVLPAASVGAPHGRHRLWFVGHAERARLEGLSGDGDDRIEPRRIDADATGPVAEAGAVVALSYAECGTAKRHGHEMAGSSGEVSNSSRKQRIRLDAGDGGVTCGLADTNSTGSQPWREATEADRYGDSVESDGRIGGPRQADGFWRDADWIACRDGKWRPVEPGTFPLAHGISGRVGRLRAYGNAIVPQVAAEVIGAFMEYETWHC